MKKITMTFSVFVDDEPDNCPIDEITHNLYEHICEWVYNVHGTVEPIDESILDNAVIGID